MGVQGSGEKQLPPLLLPPAPELPRRLSWIDVAKGMGILLVVWGHIYGGLERAGLLPQTERARWTFYFVYCVHMPLFFWIAGLHVDRGLQRGRRSFLWSKFRSIAYPYFLWSLVQGLLQATLSRHVNSAVSLESLRNIWFAPIGQFWFLYSLLLCHLLIVVVPRRSAILGVTALVVLTLSPVLPGILGETCYYFVFYAVGVLAGRRNLAAPVGNSRIGIILALSIPVFVIAGVGNGLLTDRNHETPGAVVVALSGIAIVICASLLASGWPAGVLRKLGEMSLTIYVLHVIAGAGCRIALLRVGIVDPTVHLALGMVCGTLLPVAFHLVARQLGLLPSRNPDPPAAGTGPPDY